jgi:hypothetical protein
MRQEIRREWIQTIVRVSFGRYAFSAEYLEGVRTLKKIETWLAENHLERPMFDAYGFPRFPSGNISVTFGAAEAEKTMAYRVFCNTLGLGPSLSQYRIVLLADSRTTPPAERAAYF